MLGRYLYTQACQVHTNIPLGLAFHAHGVSGSCRARWIRIERREHDRFKLESVNHTIDERCGV
jgi:hypothetical protein